MTLLMAIGAFGLVATAVTLTELLSLAPCHLCIFQRVLHLAIGLALFVAWISWNGRWIPVVSMVKSIVFALAGLATAGYQVWLQWNPQTTFGCGVGQRDIIERFVEWLGTLVPLLFMSGGLCEDDDLLIFGLSIAVWSLLAFIGFLIGGISLLVARSK
ncbi:MAG: disulfide bond formation protein B [Burkholderiaceae bacterium]|nr:disulfide bond formation protein B [Burkholderiaceae bacterium]